jgi:demethylmenaquinone methyltransferase/2-methoxy-6-polyprenyl-1,4-benzoquinol methylase
MDRPPPERERVIEIYRRRARRYDVTANLYYLIGFREWRYRQQAVQALGLRHGATVVEIGCGTGLNFRLLQQRVGPTGRIIGVDLTDAMLARAERRVAQHGWTNVELVLADATDYVFPPQVGGILSTFALSLVPECRSVVEHGCAALAPGARWVVLDLKVPDWLPRALVPALLPLVLPFAVSPEVLDRRPWATIQQAMESCLAEVAVTQRYWGFAFLAVGRRSSGAEGRDR